MTKSLFLQRCQSGFVSRSLFILALFCAASWADDTVTLQQLQKSAEDRLNATADPIVMQRQYAEDVRRWLASPLMLDITALQSDTALGTDELEVALNMELNSLTTVRLQDEFSDVSAQINRAISRQQDLFYAGIVRQIVWERVLAEHELAHQRDKLAWIREYGDQLKQRHDSREISSFVYLQWRQQQLQLEQSLIAAEHDLQRVLARYHESFGTSQLPQTYIEDLPPLENIEVHPSLALATLRYELGRKATELTQSSAHTWRLGFLLKQINTAGLRENQLGISVGIPLTVAGNTDIQTTTEWKIMQQTLKQEWITRRLDLHQQAQNAQAELASLRQQLAIQTEIANIGQQLSAHLQQLKQQSELEYTAWLNERLKQMDFVYEREKLVLTRSQLQAKLNQIYGVAL